jgi:UDP-N-acetylmuramoyl-tripeptide--D-alanyl-D-alanine ligase
MRGKILRFKEGFIVIDDSYNSNPWALMQMIDVVCRMPGFSRRILVAGEMLELGSDTNTLHFECGTYGAERGLDLVIGVRGAASEIIRAAREAAMPDSQTHFFPDADSVAGFVKEQIRKGDLVLIKGSRGVHLERIIQKLRDEFELLEKE